MLLRLREPRSRRDAARQLAFRQRLVPCSRPISCSWVHEAGSGHRPVDLPAGCTLMSVGPCSRGWQDRNASAAYRKNLAYSPAIRGRASMSSRSSSCCSA
jgi:hypothetical protein